MTEVEQMIDDCLKREDKLNAYEKRFVRGVRDRADNLSHFELATIEEIWERIT